MNTLRYRPLRGEEPDTATANSSREPTRHAGRDRPNVKEPRVRRPRLRRATSSPAARRGLAGRVAALAAEPAQPAADVPVDGATSFGTMPPSDAAQARFAGAMSAEVDALRTDLTDEILWSLLALDAGDVGGAASILETGTDRLGVFHLRLEDAIAAAAVEREAERVLASAEREYRRPQRSGASGPAIRVAFASVAAIAAATHLMSLPSEGGPRLVAGSNEVAADDGGATRDAAAAGTSATADDVANPDAAPAAPARSADILDGGSRVGGGLTSGGFAELSQTTAHQDALALMLEPTAFIDQIEQEGPPVGTDAPVDDVQRLMARLLPHVPAVDDALAVDDSLAVDVQETIGGSPDVVAQLTAAAPAEVTTAIDPSEVVAASEAAAPPKLVIRRAERPRASSEPTPSPSDEPTDEPSPEPSPTPNDDPSETPSDEPTETATAGEGGGSDGGGDGRDPDGGQMDELPLVPQDGDI